MTARTRGTLTVYKLRHKASGKAYDAQIRGQVKTAHGMQEGIILVPASYGQHFNAPLDRKERVANCERAVLCWNALAGLSNETVTRLAAWLERYNEDEIKTMLTEDNA